MKVEEVNIEKLVPYDKNVRNHPKAQIEEFKRSIEQLGQFRPVIIDENNVILAGNGLYQAMKELGKKTILVDKKVGWSEVKKKKLIIADNRIFELGISDNENLFDMFHELNSAGDLDIPGYNIEVLNDLLTSDEINEKINDYGKVDKDSIEEYSREYDIPKKSEDIEIRNENVKVDNNRRPFISCPKCNTKIEL